MTEGNAAVLCIGVFDGVHRGHRALLDEGLRQARSLDLPLTAVTFDPHPMAVVAPGSVPASLATLEHRIALLHEAGADDVHVLAFDHQMAALTPREFIERELVGHLGARAVVVGEDFRFGHGAAGSVRTLEDEGARLGFTATGVPLVGTGTERWSSTAIRRLVEAGDVAGAAIALGRLYAMDGEVVHGDHRGRELGYPTANLAWAQNPVVPADGVYAGWLVDAGERLPAAISVGRNPQFDGRDRRVESYVIDRADLDLYGHPVRVEFLERLRGQETFSDVPALIEQMERDVDHARRLVG